LVILFFGITQGSLCFGQVNEPPVVSAEGDFIYCPLSRIPVVSSFSIIDPDDTEIEAFFIQVSIGYQRGFDRLLLTGTHPNITSNWDDIQGKLTLRGNGGGLVAYADLIPAIYDVVFESTSENPTDEKEFSFSIGEANYLPSTGHYYEYVADLGITWSDARVKAEARTYFGLQGYLATITSQEEAQLSGEQVPGSGWIGGSDAGNEGVWRWMTGPEAGTVFWNGGIDGNTPNFAFWNINEPNNCCGGEDYAHVTSPNTGIRGSWNDLSNEGNPSGDFQPKGYVVEYGGFSDDLVLQLSASTRIRVPQITEITGARICGAGSLVLEAEASEGTVLWFDAPDGGNLLSSGTSFSTPILDETISYYVLASWDGCTQGRRTEVVATVISLPLVETTFTFQNCDEDGNPDGVVDFNLNEATSIITMGNTSLEVSYHLSVADAEADLNEVPPLPFSNATAPTVFARSENSLGCYSVTTVHLEVSTTSFPQDFEATIEVCDLDDPDGFYEFDLTSVENEVLALFPPDQNLKTSFYRTAENALLEEEEIESDTFYRNEIAFSQTLFVRVESRNDGSCFGIGPHVRLEVLPLVDFSVANEVQFCEGSSETIEVTDALGDYVYEWTDANGMVISTQSSATFSEQGMYEVFAISEAGCVSPIKMIEVTASSAPNLSLDVVVTDQVNGINRIVIQEDALGLGDYEFSLDGPFGPFQDAPIFTDLLPGIYTVYAVDKKGCGDGAIDVGVIGISNFITPNSDGQNDILEVLGVSPEIYQRASLQIFDRYGKLLQQMDGFSSNWDGRYQNQQMPSSDYWYILEVVDFQGNLQKRTGHFTLKR